MEIYETDPRSSVEAGWAVFQRDILFLRITSSQVFNQSVISRKNFDFFSPDGRLSSSLEVELFFLTYI